MRERLVRRGVLAGIVVAAIGAVVLVRLQRDGGPTPRNPIDGSTIVLLGDSLTEGGAWDRLLPNYQVANRGYAGYTTAELGSVVDEVVAGRPRAVLVLTGTNDLRDQHPPEWTTAELAPILDRFAEESPTTTVVVQTILPRADAPDRVVATNDAIVELARSRGLAVLDVHAAFDNGAGGLRSYETTDGIHLSTAGYRRWATELLRFLEAEQL